MELKGTQSIEWRLRSLFSSTQTQRCAGGSLKIDGVLVGQGIDENFANARRSILSSRTEPGSDDPGLFDTSLPGQATDLFNVCLLPNLLNYTKGAPGGNERETKYARPVTAKGFETANGDLWIEYLENILGLEDQPENICTIATFDRWRQWINNNLSSCDETTGEICDTPHQLLINKVLSPDQDRDATTLRTFKTYAENTTNYHIRITLNDKSDDILDQLWEENIPTWVNPDNFTCAGTTGCFNITYYEDAPGTNGLYEPKTLTVYRPARNVARNLLFNQPLTENAPEDAATLADVRSAYAGFDEIVGDFGVINDTPRASLPQGGLLALLQDLDGDWYQDYVEFGNWLYLLFNNTFLNTYLQFIDYQRLIGQQSQLAGQNQQRSASIFEGSAVLLQLNAAKRTQLSLGLKAYLDRTIVEK